MQVVFSQKNNYLLWCTHATEIHVAMPMHLWYIAMQDAHTELSSRLTSVGLHPMYM